MPGSKFDWDPITQSDFPSKVVGENDLKVFALCRKRIPNNMYNKRVTFKVTSLGDHAIINIVWLSPDV